MTSGGLLKETTESQAFNKADTKKMDTEGDASGLDRPSSEM